MKIAHLWGKAFQRDGVERLHPLVCHMVDVAELATALWHNALTPAERRLLCSLSDRDEDGVRSLGVFWAALHDLGKATPCFQRRQPAVVPLLAAEGLTFTDKGEGPEAWHTIMGVWALTPLLEANGAPPSLAYRVARSLAGHHGGWPPPGAAETLKPEQVGGEDWDEARAELVAALARVYRPGQSGGQLPDRATRQTAAFHITAMTTMCNWLASTQSWLEAATDAWHAVQAAQPTAAQPAAEPAAQAPASLDAMLAEYARRIAPLAVEAVRRAGLGRWPEPAEAPRFEALFPELTPTDLQRTAIALAPQLKGPGVVLVEAPAGSSKTEAALYLAAHLVHAQQQRGLLMVTPAAAPGIRLYARLKAMLTARYGAEQASQLVHGQARYDVSPEPVWQDVYSAFEGADGVEAMSWFLPLKRALLAPFGLTTIDEVLLSVSLTRFYYLRLSLLADKTVILHQVQAYSAHESHLLPRLVAWLTRMNCTVIVLSEGLTVAERKALLRAGGAADEAASQLADVQAPYPAITWASRDPSDGQVHTGCRASAPPVGRKVAFEWLPQGDAALVNALREALVEGGCAAVICRSVARAQAVYQALCAAEIVPAEDLTLVHAHMLLDRRRTIERQLIARYGHGAPAERRRGIVVGPQRLATNMGLDFDLVVADLAPADLLLRFAGLVHRHHEGDRPAPLQRPRLLLAPPEHGRTPPHNPQDDLAYVSYYTLRTRLALRRDTPLGPSTDVRAWLEAVYGDQEPEAASDGHAAALARARQAWQQTRELEESEARLRLLALPGAAGVFSQPMVDPVAEHTGVRLALQTLTREPTPGVTLICLHLHGHAIMLDCHTGESIDIAVPPDAAATLRLLGCSVQITHAGLMQALVEFAPPTVWRGHPLLRHYRLGLFTDNMWHVPGTRYTLRLDPQLGLIIDERRGR